MRALIAVYRFLFAILIATMGCGVLEGDFVDANGVIVKNSISLNRERADTMDDYVMATFPGVTGATRDQIRACLAGVQIRMVENTFKCPPNPAGSGTCDGDYTATDNVAVVVDDVCSYKGAYVHEMGHRISFCLWGDPDAMHTNELLWSTVGQFTGESAGPIDCQVKIMPLVLAPYQNGN